MTPQEEAELAAMRADSPVGPVKKATPPAQAKIREMVLRGKNITPRDISRLIGEMKLAGAEPGGSPSIEQPPSFEPPQLSSGQTKGGGFTSKDAQELERMRNEADVATPFADLADRAKEFFIDKPADSAAQVRKTLLEGGTMPSLKEIVTNPIAGPGAATIVAIGNLAKNIVPDEASMVESEMRTGRSPIFRAGLRTLAETGVESVPITPAEIAATAIGGKAIQAGAPIAARAASNLGKRALAGGLEAGLPAAEQALALQGLRAGGKGASASAAKGLARQLPKVEQEIANLAKSVRASEKPVKDLLIPNFMKPQGPASVSEIQAQPPAIAAPKKVYEIQQAAEQSGAHNRSVDANIKKFVNEQIRIPKGMRTPERSNLNKIQEAQIKFEEESGRKASSLLGKISKSFSDTFSPGGRSGWNILESAGPAGQELSSIGRFVSLNSEHRAGRAGRIIDDVFDGLMPNEAENIREVLDHGVQPMNNKVRSGAIALRAILDDIAREAKQHLLLKRDEQVIPWEYMKNYFPHKMDTAAMEAVLKARGTTAYNEVLHKVMAKGKISLAEAERLIQNQLARTKAKTFGKLERSREFDSPLYLKDARAVLKNYTKDAYYRLETAKGFGRQNEKGIKLLSQIEGEDSRTAATAFQNDLVGMDIELGKQKFLKRQVGLIKSLVSRMVMGTSALMNSTQGVMGSSVEAGFLNTARGMRDMMVRGGLANARREALRSGALTDDVLEEASKMVQRAYARNTGFSFTEELNRIIANAAGKHRAAELMGWMRDGKNLDEVSRYLDKYKINMSEVMRRGHFNDWEIERVGKGISDFSQGRSRPIDLPALADESYGALLFHLRTFPFQYTKFLKDSVAKEAVSGNFRPLRTAIWLAPILGEPVAVVAEALGRKRPDTWLARRIDAAGLVGGIGMARMVIESVVKGKNNLFVPPAATLATNITSELAQAAQDVRSGEGAISPAKRVSKVVLRNVVPPLAGTLPAPLAIPIIYFAKARANESKPLALLGEAINKRLGKK